MISRLHACQLGWEDVAQLLNQNAPRLLLLRQKAENVAAQAHELGQLQANQRHVQVQDNGVGFDLATLPPQHGAYRCTGFELSGPAPLN